MATITLNVQGPNVNPIADLNQMENQCKTLFSFNIKTVVNSEVKIHIERIQGGQNKQLAYDRAEYYNRGAWRPINNDEITFITTTETVPVRIHIGNSIIEHETDVDEHGNEFLTDILGNVCNIIRVTVHDITNGRSKVQVMSRYNGLARCAVEPLPVPGPHEDSYVFTVDTRLGDNPYEYEINTDSFDYDYSIQVQGKEVYGLTDNYTIQFDEPGIYDIEIFGKYPATGQTSNIQNARKLIDVKQWGTQKWKSMSGMFYECRNLHNFSAQDTPDLSEVRSLAGMFHQAVNFNGNINNWDTSNIQNMSNVFRDAKAFNQSLDNWNLSNTNTTQGMFNGAVSFDQPLNMWDVSKVKVMSNMFSYTRFNQPLDNWDTSSVTRMTSMFSETTHFNQDISSWNLSNTTYINSMFSRAKAFNMNINSWDTSQVVNMSGTFYDNKVFNQPLDNWDTSSVTNMFNMFSFTEAFNQNINNWDVSKVTNMTQMFNGAKAFNQPLNDWNTSSLTAMSGIFQNTIFNQPLSNWNTGNVTNMGWAFNSSNFNQDIGDWDVSKVTNMARLFRESPFNQDIGRWDVSNVEDMNLMFQNATDFNYDISDWDISSVTRFDDVSNNFGFMEGTNNFHYEYLDNIYNKWSQLNVQPNLRITFESQYTTLGQDGKQSLINNNGWDIYDGGMIELEVVPTDFVITVDTTIDGETSDTEFRIPVANGYSYDYTVKIGGQDYEVSDITGSHTIQFDEPGVYDIIIRGQFPRPYFRVYLSGDGYKLIDIKQWGDTGLQSLRQSFYHCSNLGEISATDAPNLSNVESMHMAFYRSGFNSDINHWDVSNIKDMTYTFDGTPFNKPLDQWDVSSVESMSRMFFESAFNQPINTWDVSSVIDFSSMFSRGSFNQPLDNWDVSSGVDFRSMFSQTSFNQNINNWNVSSATHLSRMFENIEEYDKPLNAWNLENAVDLYGMFSGAKKFNQPLNNWNVSNVTQMDEMFRDTEEFDQNINDWNVSKVSNFREMFKGANKFNQPLDNWDVSNAYNFKGMFRDTNTFNQDLSNWNMASAETLSEMFQGSIFNGDISDWVMPNIRLATNFASNFTEQYEHLDKIYQKWSQWIPEVPTLGVTREIHFGNAKYYETNQPFKDVIYNRRWRPIDGGSIPLPIEIEEDTNIIIYFDDSGSMESTYGPLVEMRDTLLKNTILPYYNNNEQAYNEKVKVISVTEDSEDPVVADMEERTLRMLNLGGKTPTSGKVIVLIFQDEAHPIYTAGQWVWDINTPRTQEYDDDLSLLRNRLDNYPENHYRGVVFQVWTQNHLFYNEFRVLLQAMENGDGQYSGVNGLSDKPEIGYRYDVTPAETAQYYLDLVVGALQELGVQI